jgi:hypothetical protein
MRGAASMQHIEKPLVTPDSVVNKTPPTGAQPYSFSEQRRNEAASSGRLRLFESPVVLLLKMTLCDPWERHIHQESAFQLGLHFWPLRIHDAESHVSRTLPSATRA